MEKLCVYITPEHYKVLSWYSKHAKKSMTDIMKEAIDWFDPELHGPFVYASFSRMSRVIELPDNYMKAVNTYSRAYELSNPKTISVIMWLFVNHNADILSNKSITEIPDTIPVRFEKDVISKIGKGKLGTIVKLAVDEYINKGLDNRTLVGTKEKGVKKERRNVYLKDELRTKLLELSNKMRCYPQHIIADAVAEYMEGRDED